MLLDLHRGVAVIGVGGGGWRVGGITWKDLLEEVDLQFGSKRWTLFIQAERQCVIATLGIALGPADPDPAFISLGPRRALQRNEWMANIAEPSLGLWQWWRPRALGSWVERAADCSGSCLSHSRTAYQAEVSLSSPQGQNAPTGWSL